MNARCSKLLNESDLYLFSGGGCHIFTHALLELMPQENYQILAVEELIGNEYKSTIHLCAAKDNLVVDSCGIHRVEDILAYYFGRENRHSCHNFKARILSPNENLLSVDQALTSNFPDKGLLNRFQMNVDEQFVSVAFQRAKSVIEACCDRYSVIGFRIGQALAEKFNKQ